MLARRGQSTHRRGRAVQAARLGFACILVAVLGATGSRSDAKECQKSDRLQKQAERFYEDAMEHFVDKEWKKAAADIEEALDIHPRALHPAFVVRETRFNRRYYLPHYYLGLCRFNLGDCPGFLRSRNHAKNGRCIEVHPIKEKELDVLRLRCMAAKEDDAAGDSVAIADAGPVTEAGPPFLEVPAFGPSLCTATPDRAAPW